MNFVKYLVLVEKINERNELRKIKISNVIFTILPNCIMVDFDLKNEENIKTKYAVSSIDREGRQYSTYDKNLISMFLLKQDIGEILFEKFTTRVEETA